MFLLSQILELLVGCKASAYLWGRSEQDPIRIVDGALHHKRVWSVENGQGEVLAFEPDQVLEITVLDIGWILISIQGKET